MMEPPPLDGDQLLFPDETGLSTNMARTRGRSGKGERCVASAPHGHWKTTTFIAGLRMEKIAAPWLLGGPMDGEAFLIDVRRVPCAPLTPRNIVILNKLRSHKVVGAIRYLPACSAGPNPIEKLFSKTKAHPRKAEHRNVDELWEEVGVIMQSVDPIECTNDFKSSVYVNN